jgi:hypothetical protein
MKVGFTSTVMLQVESNNCCSGRACNHRWQNRRGRCGVEQRACSLFFFTWRGLFTMNLCLLTLQSTLTFTHTVMFRDAWEKVCDEKDRTYWRKPNWLLHHDNAPAHTSLKTTEFVTNSNMIIVPHPPYSPMISPCFPNWKWNWRDNV